MNILFNREHELRSGWKFAAYWLLFVLILLAISFLLPLPPGPQTQLERLILNTLPFIPAFIALIVMARWVDKRPLAVFGVGFHDGWLRHVFIGLGVSAAMLAVVTLINGSIRGFAMVWTASNTTSRSLIVTVLVLIMSAAQEELLFRGYPLQVLLRGIGEWPAVLLMSAAFGVVHMLNPNATILGAVNTALAGLMLSIAYLKTRSLWLPYGLHLGWNLGLGFILGYPLSGIEIDSLWKTVTSGPRWLAGGQYGPEGGIVGTLAFVAASIAIRSNKIQVSEKLS